MAVLTAISGYSELKWKRSVNVWQDDVPPFDVDFKCHIYILLQQAHSWI